MAGDGVCCMYQAAAELGNTDVGAELDADAAPAGDAGEAAAAALAAATQPEREVHSFEIDPTQARGRHGQALRASHVALWDCKPVTQMCTHGCL